MLHFVDSRVVINIIDDGTAYEAPHATKERPTSAERA